MDGWCAAEHEGQLAGLHPARPVYDFDLVVLAQQQIPHEQDPLGLRGFA